jgi:hypothetical protein
MTEFQKRLITKDEHEDVSIRNFVVKIDVAPLQQNLVMVRFFYYDSPDDRATNEKPKVEAFALAEEAVQGLSEMLAQTIATRTALRAIDQANRKPH